MRTVLIAFVLAASAVPAAAAPDVHRCGNVDRSDRFGRPAAHGAFGIFNVRAQGVACRPARRLAHRWLGWAQKATNPTKPHLVGGYLCRSHAPAAQELAVRCATKTALVRFTGASPTADQAAAGCPNQAVSASARPTSMPSPTQAT